MSEDEDGLRISCPCGKQIEATLESKRVKCPRCGCEHLVFRQGATGARVSLNSVFPVGSWNVVRDGRDGLESEFRGARFDRDWNRNGPHGGSTGRG